MKQSSAMVKTILTSAVAAFLGSAVISGAMAALASKEVLTLQTARWLTMLSGNGLLLLACWMTAGRAGKGRLQVSTMVMGLWVLLCLVGKALLFPQASVSLSWSMSLPVLAALGGGVLSSRKKTRHS